MHLFQKESFGGYRPETLKIMDYMVVWSDPIISSSATKMAKGSDSKLSIEVTNKIISLKNMIPPHPTK